MKFSKFHALFLICYLGPAIAVDFVLPYHIPSFAERAARIKSDVLDKIGNPDLEALQATVCGVAEAVKERSAQALEGARQIVDKAKDKLRDEYGFDEDWGRASTTASSEPDDEGEPFIVFSGDSGMKSRPCAKQDCKKHIFWDELTRWVKQGLADMNVVINDHPYATTAFMIGVSVLVVNLITGGAILPAVLHSIGFGAQGPIKDTIAAAIQSKLGNIDAGSIFAQLQSAAMNGAAMDELQKIANIAFAGIATAGAAYTLNSAHTGPLGQAGDFEPKEWRAWYADSRTNFSPSAANRMVHYWGAPIAKGCVAYGYQQYRAPLWYVSEQQDPLQACVRTPATINGIGFKTPLGCEDEGPKRGVSGMWYLPTNGTNCVPNWSTFEDEGCILYGQRRKFSRLLGLRHQDDWMGVCESTPAVVGGQSFAGPTYCEDKGILGIFGVFDFPDKTCECTCIRL